MFSNLFNKENSSFTLRSLTNLIKIFRSLSKRLTLKAIYLKKFLTIPCSSNKRNLKYLIKALGELAQSVSSMSIKIMSRSFKKYLDYHRNKPSLYNHLLNTKAFPFKLLISLQNKKQLYLSKKLLNKKEIKELLINLKVVKDKANK